MLSTRAIARQRYIPGGPGIRTAEALSAREHLVRQRGGVSTRPPGGVTSAYVEFELLARIASQYFLQDRTQADIAIEYGLSRQKVQRLIRRAREQGIVEIHVHSAPVLHIELENKLRPKFGLSTSHVLGILELFRDTFETVIPSCPVAAITDDPNDNRILEAALAAKADAIVSGDKHLLDLGTWNGIPILSPADFLRHLK